MRSQFFEDVEGGRGFRLGIGVSLLLISDDTIGDFPQQWSGSVHLFIVPLQQARKGQPNGHKSSGTV
jgi:hypothetical protein